MKEKRKLLRILFLEANKTKIAFLENALRDSLPPFTIKAAKTEKEFLKFLIRFDPDVILSGRQLEKYSALEALTLMHDEKYRIPFIVIEDNLNEDAVSELLQKGAEACVMLSNLDLLPVLILKEFERKEANVHMDEVESQLKNQKDRLQTIFKNTPEAIINIGFKGEILEINPTGLQMLQLNNLKKLGKKDIFDFIHQEDVGRFKKFHNSVGIGNKKTEKFRIVGKKKEEHWIETSAVPLLDDERHVVSVLTINRDITEQQKAHSEISYLSRLLENVSDAIVFIDKDRRILSWNSAAEKIFGWKSKEAIGKIILELIQPEFFDSSLMKVVDSLDQTGNWEGQLKVLTKANSHLVVSVNSSRFKNEKGKMVGTIVTFRDITARLEAEKAKRESEIKFETLMAQAPVAIYSTDFSGKIIHFNNKFLDAFELTPEQVGRDEWKGRIHPDDANWLVKLREEAIHAVKNLELHFRLLINDHIKYIFLKSSPFFDEEGKQVGRIGTILDHTDNEKFNDQIQLTQTMFQNIFEHSPDPIFIEDIKGNILNANLKACILHGMEYEELVGKNIFDLVPENRRETVMHQFQQFSEGTLQRLKTSTWNKDGKEMKVEIRSNLINYFDKVALLLHVLPIES